MKPSSLVIETREGRSYREYPYIVRRRSPDEPAKERQRIASDLSGVQAKLNAFQARLLVEDRFVGERYAPLVKKTPRIVGAMIIKSGWDSEPVGAEAEMQRRNMTSASSSLDGQYVEALILILGSRQRRTRIASRARLVDRGRGRTSGRCSPARPSAASLK